MAFNNVPVNGFPQIKELEKLDALAKQIEDMPTFSSTDRAWLDEWEAKLPELPADPETDGVKVLTATTESGETVKSWEDPELPIASASTLGGVKVGSGLSIDAETGVLSASGSGGGGVPYSTAEQDTGLTWTDGSKIYQKTYQFSAAKSLSGNAVDVTSEIDNTASIKAIIKGEGFYSTYTMSLPIYCEKHSNSIKLYSAMGMQCDVVTFWYTKNA